MAQAAGDSPSEVFIRVDRREPAPTSGWVNISLSRTETVPTSERRRRGLGRKPYPESVDGIRMLP